MDPVRPGCQGDVHPVVDDQGDACGCQYLFQGQGLGQKFPGGGGFFTQLHTGNPGPDRIRHHGCQRSAQAQRPVRDQINAFHGITP
jgi:hypothetical protein